MSEEDTKGGISEVYLNKRPELDSSGEIISRNVELALRDIQTACRTRALVEMLGELGVTLPDRTPKGESETRFKERYISLETEQPRFEAGPYVADARWEKIPLEDDLDFAGGSVTRIGPLERIIKVPPEQSSSIIQAFRKGGLRGAFEKVRSGWRLYSVVKEELIYTDAQRKEESAARETELMGGSLTVIKRLIAGEKGKEPFFTTDPDLSFTHPSYDQLDVYLSKDRQEDLDAVAEKYRQEEFDKWKDGLEVTYAKAEKIDQMLKTGMNLDQILDTLKKERQNSSSPP